MKTSSKPEPRNPETEPFVAAGLPAQAVPDLWVTSFAGGEVDAVPEAPSSLVSYDQIEAIFRAAAEDAPGTPKGGRGGWIAAQLRPADDESLQRANARRKRPLTASERRAAKERGYRDYQHVTLISAAVVDYDEHPSEQPDWRPEAWPGAVLYHSSHRWAPKYDAATGFGPCRFRAVLPFAEPIPLAEYQTRKAALQALLPRGAKLRAPHQPAFLPTCPLGGEVIVGRIDGAPLDWRAVAARVERTQGSDAPAANLPEPRELTDDEFQRLLEAAREHMPQPGSGLHDACMAIGGALRRAGVSREQTEALADDVVRVVGSDAPATRAKAAVDAWDRCDRGATAYGATKLAELCPDGGALIDVLRELTPKAQWIEAMAEQWRQREHDNATATVEDSVLDALPDWVRDFVVAQQEEMRTPIAMNIGVALGVIGACVSGHVKVHIHGTWTTETGLYVCCVAPPGKKKSPALKRATAPIKAWVAEQRTAGLAAYSRAVVERKRQKTALDKAEQAQRQTYGTDEEADKLEELIKAQAAWDAGQDPVMFEMLTADATPEKLVDLLAKHGRIACITGEGSKVFNMLSNGSQGKPKAGQADASAWLDAYDGQLDKVHRIGREAEEPRHKHTTLSALIMAQPIVMQRVVSDLVLCGEGLVPRLTLVSCTSEGVRYAPGEIPAPVPAPIAETWDAGVRFLLDIPEGTEVRLSDEAFRAFIAWRDELEPRRTDGGDLTGVMSAWAEKTEERAVRIAAGLWACDGASETSPGITGEQMVRAVTICRWLVDHALRVITGGQAQAKSDALEASVLRLLADGPRSTNALRMGLTKTKREGLEPCLARMAKAGRVVADGSQWALAE